MDSITRGGRFIGFDGHRNQNQGFGQQQTAAIPSETTTSIGPAKTHCQQSQKKVFLHGSDDSSLDTAQGIIKMPGRKSTGRFISSWI